MADQPSIEFWFDFPSTYSYPAAMRVDERAQSVGIRVIWRAFLLGPIFAKQGWNTSPFNIYPSKGRYMWRDMERICAREGLPFVQPPGFPQNGLLAGRIACAFSDEPWVPTFARAVFTAQFADGQNIADKEILAACLTEAGQDPEHAFEQATTPEAKDLMRARTARAEDLGLFGAPSFLVGREVFWGYDRLDWALQFALDRA